MKPRRAIPVVLVLSWILLTVCVSPSRPRSLPEGDTIVRKVNRRTEGAAVRRELVLTLRQRTGQEQVREAVFLRGAFDDQERTILYFESPQSIRGTVFLTHDYEDPERADHQWLYLPALGRVRRIPAADRNRYLLGTDLTYGDLQARTRIPRRDYGDFTTEGRESVDGTICYKVSYRPRTPKKARQLGYSRVVQWIDPEIWMYRKARFWDRAGNRLKTITNRRIERVDGIWTVQRLHVVNHKTGHRTEMDFTRTRYGRDFEKGFFSPHRIDSGGY